MAEITIKERKGKMVASVTGTSLYYPSTQRALDLDDNAVKTVVEKCFMCPNEFSRALFSGHTWKLTPLVDQIRVKETSNVLAVANDVMRNKSRVTGTYTSSLTHTVTHSMDVSWSGTDKISTSFDVSVGVFLKGAANMQYSTALGKQLSKRVSETVGTSRQMSVTLKPGEETRTKLTLKKRQIKVIVPFMAEICGSAALMFTGRGDPTYFPISQMLHKLGRGSKFLTQAEIDVTCYTDADVVLYDSDDDSDIHSDSDSDSY